MTEVRTMTTREAAGFLGWPQHRLHDVAHVVPEFAEVRVGGSAGRNGSNGWPSETVEMIRMLQHLGCRHTEAVRIACMARLEDGRIVIDPRDLRSVPHQDQAA